MTVDVTGLLRQVHEVCLRVGLKDKYVLISKVLLEGFRGLKVQTLSDIEKRLREAGYSDGAIKEILRWYRLNNADKRT